MLTAILAFAALSAVFGLLLGYSAIRFHIEGDPIADQIDALLPQTQCGQCGHPGCRPYAEAVARGEDDINKCTPGGEATVQALADLLGRDPVALDAEEKLPAVAHIDPQNCIGCTKCLQACPVDAIVGAAKQLHAVLDEACTGCELCLAPCPVDCISMVPVATDIRSWRWPYPQQQDDSRRAAA
ncbi:electron transport complex subunit RsxB [Marichromatium gracile]|uniref:Ion-translocating oxidoreductase complex subunit B n=2 Tax=Marichromatium TaxID=85076 RepID=W0E0R3_MARPU|nr:MULTISPECIES: electron transport complex subunit RsxB [Marichromatium]MBO8087492.1 electron transport complex subunit RsxB [Marichromatium sp.]AHF03118.1 electron transporter RnfB [Marichromatium purpuratum 984]KXX65008.1 electron transport complex subunit RsxB [Marichromatium gracile]MBK1708665.1 electron transport complex subunit RsxB [Marichromatium gracile]MCF1184358.1 electron transport complex subunit RsxB [Marichromatium gracile]